jgi:hypothetical protein
MPCPSEEVLRERVQVNHTQHQQQQHPAASQYLVQRYRWFSLQRLQTHKGNLVEITAFFVRNFITFMTIPSLEERTLTQSTESRTDENGALELPEQHHNDGKPEVATSTTSNLRPPPQGRRRKQFAVSTRWERQVAENGLPNDHNKYFCCCARRLGNMFVLLEYPDGTPIVVAGPCWPFCAFVTLPLIIVISGLVSYFIVLSNNSALVSIVVLLLIVI